ncbi:MAG: hypothetical protein RLZZ93_172, partial [Actinomycetota bacterium]
MPPMNIEASECTMWTGRSAANHRSPGASITAACFVSASGPMTRLRRASAITRRTCCTRSSTGDGSVVTGPAYERPEGSHHYDSLMTEPATQGTQRDTDRGDNRRMPRWVPRAVVLFWAGALGAVAFRHVFHRLSSFLILMLVALFIALAMEPGVNRLEARGWKRGRATLMILLAVIVVTMSFFGVVGTLVGQQVADLLKNSSTYVNDTVQFINDTFNANIDAAEVNARIADPNGPVQEFIRSQQSQVFNLSVQALNVLFQSFTVLLFAFYLVADAPRLRRSICARLRPEQQERLLSTWDLAIKATAGYLDSRLLLAALSAFFHWIALQAIGTPAPIAMALWVGLVSQFLPVIGTYLAGVLPLLL